MKDDVIYRQAAIDDIRMCDYALEIYEIGLYDWIAECNYCHSSGMRAASANDAAKAWNTRKEDKND